MINENESGCIDFARSKNIAISSTCFPHRKIHKRAWTSSWVDVQRIFHLPYLWKDDRFSCENYRGISLLRTCCKVLWYLIERRLESFLKKYQRWFQWGKSTAVMCHLPATNNFLLVWDQWDTHIRYRLDRRVALA